MSRGSPQIGLSTEDVAEMSGLSTRQVRAYCGVGVFRDENIAPGSGARRSFLSDDVRVASVLYRLSELSTRLTGLGAGLSHGLVVDVVAALNATGPTPRWLAVTNDGEVVVGRAVPPLSDTCILMDLSA